MNEWRVSKYQGKRALLYHAPSRHAPPAQLLLKLSAVPSPPCQEHFQPLHPQTTSPGPQGGFWHLHHHIRGTEADFSDLPAHASTQLVLGARDQSRGHGYLPQLPTFRTVSPFPPTHNQTLFLYLCLRGSFPALFSSSSNLLRASSNWVRGLGAGLGGMVGSWMKG